VVVVVAEEEEEVFVGVEGRRNDVARRRKRTVFITFHFVFFKVSTLFYSVF